MTGRIQLEVLAVSYTHLAAEQEAEKARSARDEATLEADVIVKAEIEKRQKELQAEAEAEQIRRRAKGEADAIFAKMDAQARGTQEILMLSLIHISKSGRYTMIERVEKWAVSGSRRITVL